MADDAVTLDSGLQALVVLARYHGEAVEFARLKHEFGHQQVTSPWSNLVRAARTLSLKAKRHRLALERLHESNLPMMALLTDGRFVVVGKQIGDDFMVWSPGAAQPSVYTSAKLKTCWTGQVLLVAHRTRNPIQARFNIRWFIPALMRHKALLVQVLIASLFLQLFALLTPLFFQVVIDKVLVHRGLTTLDVLAIGLLLVSFFEVVLNALRTYVFAHTTSRIDAMLGTGLFAHLLALPLSYFENRRVGDTVARVRELDTIRSFLTGSSLTLLVDLLFTFVFIGVMFAYSRQLTYIVMASLPIYALLSLLITPVLRARVTEKFKLGADNQAFLVESIAGISTVKSNAIEPLSQLRWESQLAAYVHAAFRASNLGNIANQGAALINKVTLVVLLWLGAKLVIEGDISVGQLVAFNMLSARVSSPVLRLVQLWQDFQQTGIAVERLGDILNAPGESTQHRARASLPHLQGRVRLQNVAFRYAPDAARVLEAITLEVTPGEVVGIVGASGSGKSTLVKLLQRIYLPTAGRIFIDDVDIVMADPSWLRRAMGVVMQESFLFNRSIRENIALRDPSCSLEVVVRAAKMSGAHEFIVDLPEGYDTEVFEQGVNFSGGQRQRLSLARALLANPKILILDEATSALDYESECVIQRNMRAICHGRTVFIIAHRLSALRSASRIIVLDEGRVVEQGSVVELLRQGGFYARLHAYQHADVQSIWPAS